MCYVHATATSAGGCSVKGLSSPASGAVFLNTYHTLSSFVSEELYVSVFIGNFTLELPVCVMHQKGNMLQSF